MPKSENSNLVSEIEEALFDQSKRAEVTLASILDEETPEEIIDRELSTTGVEEERRAGRVLKRETNRIMSRVLFITKDTSYFEPKSEAMNTIFSLAALFAEVHIMVLVPLGGNEKTKRVTDNVWVYRASAQYWWWLPFAAVAKAKEQLAFADGFRPDLIVALDPFESGLAALKIASKFQRAAQIHVSVDFFSSEFLARESANPWRKRMASYVINRAMSVRTQTGVLKNQLLKKFKGIPDLKVLPQFHNFSALIEAEPSFQVHEKYPEYIFTILAFGPLTADSPLHDVFSALHFVLRNPRIGLIVIGKGPAKKLFQEKVELLGLTKDVIFLNEADDLTSYLKTADVLVQTDTTEESENIVLKAAAAGLPMVMYETEMRKDLFKDGETAGLCEKGDVSGITNRVNDLLNSQGLRVQYENGTRAIVKDRLIEDETTYYRALRDSIEVAMSVSTEKETEPTPLPPTETKSEESVATSEQKSE